MPPPGMLRRGARRRVLAGLAVAAALVALVAALLAWRRRRRLARETFDDDLAIFVSVASYRDPDCLDTLKSMFENAANAGRVVAGVCEQNTSAARELCLPADFKWHDRVRRISVPHKEARGPTYARYLCSTLFRGEAYFCQIDSHTRFVKDWDRKAVAMLRACPSAKPVLTHYPHDWDQSATGTTDVPVLCKSKFDPNGVPTFEAVTLRASAKPRPVPFTSGGFVFGPGSMLAEVPYDPDLPQLFQGEEILYSARLWTAGYDFYTPTENLVFHHYYRKSSPKYWDDIEFSTQQKRTLDKVRALLTGKLPAYRYGMGAARTLAQYWKYAGLDWATKKSTSQAKFCGPATVRRQTR